MPDSCPSTILTRNEAARRRLLLSELQAALNGLGVPSILARNHRLVLRWHNNAPSGPSGQTNPRLHIFIPAGTVIATTDGSAYHLPASRQCPASDSAAAAALVSDRQPVIRA